MRITCMKLCTAQLPITISAEKKIIPGTKKWFSCMEISWKYEGKSRHENFIYIFHAWKFHIYFSCMTISCIFFMHKHDILMHEMFMPWCFHACNLWYEKCQCAVKMQQVLLWEDALYPAACYSKMHVKLIPSCPLTRPYVPFEGI